MKPVWRTCWQQRDIVVLCDDREIDRLPGDRIEAVYFLCRSAGETPNDIEQVAIRLDDGAWILAAAETGFAGRVNFERETFWAEKDCVRWIAGPRAGLPMRLRLGHRAQPWRRLEADSLADAARAWDAVTPETWTMRKRRRIERSRPFGFASAAH
jgi:hypothetical protein